MSVEDGLRRTVECTSRGPDNGSGICHRGTDVLVDTVLASGPRQRLARYPRGAALRHARDLLDHPNERSSHAAPTPRGGGLAIVASFLAGLVALHALGEVNDMLLWAIGGGAAIALVVRRRPRPSLAAPPPAGPLCRGAGPLWLCGMPPLRSAAATWSMAGPDSARCRRLVWLLNLYNFMDGSTRSRASRRCAWASGLLLGGAATGC